MTSLDIGLESIKKPIRLDLARLEAWMIWPDDPEARERLYRSAMLEEGAARIDTLPEQLLRQFAKEALSVPRITDLQDNALERRWIHGLVAGLVVLRATFLAQADPEQAALQKVQSEISAMLKGVFQIEPRTMNNKEGPIYKFRSVAHLWATHAFFRLRGDTTWPCRVDQLPAFLATAEAQRSLAEQSRAPRSNSTVMRPGEAVKLPDMVIDALPRVELKIAR